MLRLFGDMHSPSENVDENVQFSALWCIFLSDFVVIFVLIGHVV